MSEAAQPEVNHQPEWLDLGPYGTWRTPCFNCGYPYIDDVTCRYCSPPGEEPPPHERHHPAAPDRHDLHSPTSQ